MDFFIIKQSDITQIKFFNSIVECLSELNTNLSEIYTKNDYRYFKGDSPKFINSKYKSSIIMSWETLNVGYAFGEINTKLLNIHISNYIRDNIHLFLIPNYKENSEEYKNILYNLNNNSININLITDLMINKELSNPYILFVDILRIDRNLFYQSFINYLNKIIINSEEKLTNPNLTGIINNFFINGKPSDVSNFEDLFLFYLKSRRLTPLNFQTKEYTSNLKYKI